MCVGSPRLSERKNLCMNFLVLASWDCISMLNTVVIWNSMIFKGQSNQTHAPGVVKSRRTGHFFWLCSFDSFFPGALSFWRKWTVLWSFMRRNRLPCLIIFVNYWSIDKVSTRTDQILVFLWCAVAFKKWSWKPSRTFCRVLRCSLLAASDWLRLSARFSRRKFSNN